MFQNSIVCICPLRDLASILIQSSMVLKIVLKEESFLYHNCTHIYMKPVSYLCKTEQDVANNRCPVDSGDRVKKTYLNIQHNQVLN